jgi:Fic family protein
MRTTGSYQSLGELNSFIPYSLPPKNPSFQVNAEIISLYGEASFALGQVNEMSMRLRDPKPFIKAYVLKEALLSSAIEGIHTTIINAFTYPLDFKYNKDTQLVVNYTKALDAAITMLREDSLPLVSRVILQAHKVLLSVGEGDTSAPGSYRKQSVRVGHLVPPPAPEIPILMTALEKYMNEPSALPPLLRAGLVHVHFEIIHPFLDGNGRIGRLLIVLMLINNGLLHAPILYPSYYFKKHHAEYYQKLDRVRTHGDFEGWIVYYLQAIKESAIDAYRRAKEIEELETRLKHIIETDPLFARMKETANMVLHFLFTQPSTDITAISQSLGKAYNTISHVLKCFIALKLVSMNAPLKRNKRYHFDVYLTLLEKDYL